MYGQGTQPMQSQSAKGRSISIWKIARWGILLIAVVVVVQMLRNPAPIAIPPPPQVRAQLAEQFQLKMGGLESASSRGETGAQAQFTSEEITAAFVSDPSAATAAASSAVPKTVPGTDEALPEAKNTLVAFEDDSVLAQFTVDRFGKDVTVTMHAHIGAEGGYLQIQPTEFKVGQLSIPISVVESVVKKKLSEPETREKLKLPDWVSDVRIENSQLVLKEK